MSKQYRIVCPECGSALTIIISESSLDHVWVTFCDIDRGSEDSYLVREVGYEFGEKGGECNG